MNKFIFTIIIFSASLCNAFASNVYIYKDQSFPGIQPKAILDDGKSVKEKKFIISQNKNPAELEFDDFDYFFPTVSISLRFDSKKYAYSELPFILYDDKVRDVSIYAAPICIIQLREAAIKLNDEDISTIYDSLKLQRLFQLASQNIDKINCRDIYSCDQLTQYQVVLVFKYLQMAVHLSEKFNFDSTIDWFEFLHYADWLEKLLLDSNKLIWLKGINCVNPEIQCRDVISKIRAITIHTIRKMYLRIKSESNLSKRLSMHDLFFKKLKSLKAINIKLLDFIKKEEGFDEKIELALNIHDICRSIENSQKKSNDNVDFTGLNEKIKVAIEHLNRDTFNRDRLNNLGLDLLCDKLIGLQNMGYTELLEISKNIKNWPYELAPICKQ